MNRDPIDLGERKAVLNVPGHLQLGTAHLGDATRLLVLATPSAIHPRPAPAGDRPIGNATQLQFLAPSSVFHPWPPSAGDRPSGRRDPAAGFGRNALDDPISHPGGCTKSVATTRGPLRPGDAHLQPTCCFLAVRAPAIRIEKLFTPLCTPPALPRDTRRPSLPLGHMKFCGLSPARGTKRSGDATPQASGLLKLIPPPASSLRGTKSWVAHGRQIGKKQPTSRAIMRER
ncbi:hypothetical protein NDU88_005708 [Pleurodeles waltl]|uniref:Uncharacterized protein n=1 Tax=Pleurodeles waltl TaxID=8319 RepID=A0AAV7WC75_PLEWA|nr:hypothetical protein NDU88_005708 [Pleurodeles waltl]